METWQKRTSPCSQSFRKVTLKTLKISFFFSEEDKHVSPPAAKNGFSISFKSKGVEDDEEELSDEGNVGIPVGIFLYKAVKKLKLDLLKSKNLSAKQEHTVLFIMWKPIVWRV